MVADERAPAYTALQGRRNYKSGRRALGGRFIDKWKKEIMQNHDFSWKSDIYEIRIKKQSVKPKSEKGGVLRLFADAGASLPLPIERTTQEL